MSKNYSRLLVLVEDTSATSRLWPSWQRHSLEPLLQLLQNGQLGTYELCLVAFYSTDGQSDALFQKTSWTTNPATFRRQLDALKFEGMCGGHALADALSEAVYLSQQPSNLTEVENFETHLLVCATDAIGRLPRLWTFSESVHELHALSILGNLPSLNLSVSFLTDSSSNRILTQSYTALAGVKAANWCKMMSKGKGYLALIHPKWSHGMMVHCEMEKHKIVLDRTDSHSSSSAKTSLMVQNVDPQEPAKQDVEDGPVFESDQFQEQDLQISTENPKTGQLNLSQGEFSSSQDPLTDAVDLTICEEDRKSVEQDLSNLSPMDLESDLEEELLGLRASGDRSPSDRKRKIEETVDRPSRVYQDVFASETGKAVQNKPSNQAMVLDDFNSCTFGVSSPCVQNQRTDDSRNSFLISPPDQYPFSLDFNDKLSPNLASPLSRESRGFALPENTDYFHQKPKLEGPERDALNLYENHHSLYDKVTPNLMNCAPEMESSFLYNKDTKTQQQHLSNQHKSKRLRTESRIEKPFSNSEAPWQLQSNPVLQPTTGFRSSHFSTHLKTRRRWTGPLFYQQDEANGPFELFEVEVKSAGALDFSSLLAGQTEMMVHSLGMRKVPRIKNYCVLSIDQSTIKSSGEVFLDRLIKGKESAVVNLNCRKPGYLVLFAHKFQNGETRLVAGF